MNKINKIKLRNTTYDICSPATSTEYGLIKIGYSGSNQNYKNYAVQLDDDGKAYVEVPWTDTTYGVATSNEDGLMSASDKQKLEGIAANATHILTVLHDGIPNYSGIGNTAGRYYQIEIDSDGKAFVNVPWVSGEGGSSSSDGFTSITSGNTTISSSIQPDLYISSNAGITAYIDQGQASLSDKNVLYIDINEASSSYGGIKVVGNQTGIIDQTANNYPVQLTTGNQNSGYAFVNVPVVNGEDGEDGNGIQSITITYQSGTSNTAAPSGTWSTTVPNVTPGNYLWTKILITCTDGTTTTAYSVARQGVDGTNGSSGSGASAMTILPSLGTNSTAEPNILYRLGLLNSSLTITLADTNSTLSSSTVAEYLFRFKTGSSSTVTFTTSLDNVSILYPFDYVLNANTEYEVSVLWDGSSLLVRNCAYQSNS